MKHFILVIIALFTASESEAKQFSLVSTKAPINSFLQEMDPYLSHMGSWCSATVESIDPSKDGKSALVTVISKCDNQKIESAFNRAVSKFGFDYVCKNFDEINDSLKSKYGNLRMHSFTPNTYLVQDYPQRNTESFTVDMKINGAHYQNIVFHMNGMFLAGHSEETNVDPMGAEIEMESAFEIPLEKDSKSIDIELTNIYGKAPAYDMECTEICYAK